MCIRDSGWGDVRLADHPLVRAETVRLAGYVSDAELAALYRGARVMLYPSLYEGCLLYTSPSPRDRTRSRMPSSA